MALYYVSTNPQVNGDHDVHKATCILMPNSENSQYLGSFENCFDAVLEAKKYFPNANGCYICSPEGHTKKEEL